MCCRFRCSCFFILVAPDAANAKYFHENLPHTPTTIITTTRELREKKTQNENENENFPRVWMRKKVAKGRKLHGKRRVIESTASGYGFLAKSNIPPKNSIQDICHKHFISNKANGQLKYLIRNDLSGCPRVPLKPFHFCEDFFLRIVIYIAVLI